MRTTPLNLMSQENAVWMHALELYAIPGIAERLIQAQDDYGIDVNLVLAACWISRLHISYPNRQGFWPQWFQISNRWQSRISRLRSLRRSSRPGRLRQCLKRLELQGERLENDALWAALPDEVQARTADGHRPDPAMLSALVAEIFTWQSPKKMLPQSAMKGLLETLMKACHTVS